MGRHVVAAVQDWLPSSVLYCEANVCFEAVLPWTQL
jgi:hypothetical protein